MEKIIQKNFNRGPYYNVGALPPRPKKTPPDLSSGESTKMVEWIRAEKLIKEIEKIEGKIAG